MSYVYAITVLNTHLTSSEANKRSRRSLTDTLTSLGDSIGNTTELLKVGEVIQ